MRPNTIVKLSILSCLAIGIGGCGSSDTPPLGSVSGVVTFNEEPLANAEVVFQPKKGRASLGVTDSDGNYSLDYTGTVNGALIGSHHVMITSAVQPFSDESGEGKDRKGRPEILPDRYHSKSTLKADVKAGSNTIDFGLSSKE